MYNKSVKSDDWEFGQMKGNYLIDDTGQFIITHEISLTRVSWVRRISAACKLESHATLDLSVSLELVAQTVRHVLSTFLVWVRPKGNLEFVLPQVACVHSVVARHHSCQSKLGGKSPNISKS